jgi:hypothetical protein
MYGSHPPDMRWCGGVVVQREFAELSAPHQLCCQFAAASIVAGKPLVGLPMWVRSHLSLEHACLIDSLPFQTEQLLPVYLGRAGYVRVPPSEKQENLYLSKLGSLRHSSPGETQCEK